MNSALTLDRGHAAHAADGGRVRALPEADRHEPVAVIAEAAGGGDALSKLAGGWSGPPRQRSFWLVVAGVHVLGAWALSRSLGTPAVAPKPGPVQVRLIAPPPPPPVQIQRVMSPELRLPTAPLTPLIVPPDVQVTAPAVVAVVASPPAPAPVVAAPAPVARTAPVTAGVKQLPPGSVRYLAMPELVMPRMSRRLGESGTVLLHILVDERGQLKSATVKKSSGFDRLDQQALLDIRSARFAPYLEQGQPVEWEADAGLQYELAGR